MIKCPRCESTITYIEIRLENLVSLSCVIKRAGQSWVRNSGITASLLGDVDKFLSEGFIECPNCATKFQLKTGIISLTCGVCKRTLEEDINYCQYHDLYICKSCAIITLKYCSSCSFLKKCPLGKFIVKDGAIR